MWEEIEGKTGSRSTKKRKEGEEVKEQRMQYKKRRGNEKWKMQEGEDEMKRGSRGQTGMRKGKGEGRMEVADENMIGYIRRKGGGNR